MFDLDAPMAVVIEEYARGPVVASDIFDYGYGHAARALALATEGVGMFARLQWIEAIGRYEKLFRDRPPMIFAPFVVVEIETHIGRLADLDGQVLQQDGGWVSPVSSGPSPLCTVSGRGREGPRALFKFHGRRAPVSAHGWRATR
jgi:hypothetical protein